MLFFPLLIIYPNKIRPESFKLCSTKNHEESFQDNKENSLFNYKCRLKKSKMQVNQAIYLSNDYLNLTIFPINYFSKSSHKKLLNDSYSGSCGENVTYQYSDGILTINGTGEMKSYGFDYKPPWEPYKHLITTINILNGVTIIGNSAFFDCYELTSVSIPDSVTVIGFNSFCNCEKLISVDIPNGVKSIDIYAFENCVALQSFHIPSSVEYFSGISLEYCIGIHSVTVDDTFIELTSIHVFSNSQSFSTSEKYSIFKVSSSNSLVQSFSLSLVLTFIQKRSVSFSFSNSISISYYMSYNEIYGTYTVFITNIKTMHLFPYIIYFLSPSYLPTIITFSIMKEKSLTKEQLIGMTCGSVATIFLILYICIMIYRYKQNKKYHFSSSSFWSTESEELNHQDKEQNHQNDIEHESNNLESFDDSDIDFWL